MSSMVTARVPEGVRSRAADVLKEIGATTSDLVNAAFNYVVQERKLPIPADGAGASGEMGVRQLDASQVAQLQSFMGSVKVAVPGEWGQASFEELLDQAAGERYADLC